MGISGTPSTTGPADERYYARGVFRGRSMPGFETAYHGARIVPR